MTTSAAPSTATGRATVAITEVANHVLDLLLTPRIETLKHKAPKDRYVHRLIRDVRAGKAKPAHMMLAISFADVEDPAVSLGEVLEPYRQAITFLTARRQEIETHGVDAPSLLPLILAESRKEAAENDAERVALADPTNPEKLEDLLRCSAAEREVQDRRDAGIRTRLANLVTDRGRRPMAVR